MAAAATQVAFLPAGSDGAMCEDGPVRKAQQAVQEALLLAAAQVKVTEIAVVSLVALQAASQDREAELKAASSRTDGALPASSAALQAGSDGAMCEGRLVRMAQTAAQ